MAVDQIIKRAHETFGKGQFDYSIALARQAMIGDPNNADAHRLFALSAQKKLAAAGGIGKLQSFSLKGQETAILGALKAYSKNPMKKIELCLDHLAKDPNNLKLRLELAIALEESKAIDGAIIEARMAAEIDPKSFDALKAVGLMMARRGTPEDIITAQVALETATKIKPEDRDCSKELRNLAARATIAKTGLDKAKDYRDTLKDSKKSEELERRTQQVRTDDQFVAEFESLKKEFAANPKDHRIPRKIGDLFFDSKKDFDGAAVWYQKAVDINPQDSTLKDKMEDCLIRKFDVQIATARQAGDAAKEKELRVERLKYELVAYERRVKDRPTDPQAKFDLGKRVLMAGQLDKGVGLFQQSVKDPKLKIDSLIYLGACFQKKGMYDLADDQYAKAETGGFIVPEKLRNIWYERARCKAESGDLPGAIELGKKIMTEDISFKDISELVTQWTQQNKKS